MENSFLKPKMSSIAKSIHSEGATKRGASWSLWLRQVAAIMRLEVKKNFLGKRSILVYLLAFMPVGLLGMLALFTPRSVEWENISSYPTMFSAIYNALILRTVVFFGCVKSRRSCVLK